MPASLRRVIAAASAANLLMLGEYARHSFWGPGSYYAPGLDWPVFLALFSVWLILTGVVWALWEGAESFGRRWQSELCLCLLLTISAYLLNQLRVVLRISEQVPALSARHFLGDWGQGGTAAKLVLVAAGLAFAIRRWPRELSRAASQLLLCLAPMLFFTLVSAGGRALTMTYHSPPPSGSARKPRMLWILFDELEQQYLDRGRLAELRLPAFDRLRDESLHAERAFPPGDATVISIPALLTGRVLSRVHLLGYRTLKMETCDGGPTAVWGETGDFFAACAGLGLRVSVSGWHHPYCRIFGRRVDCLPLYEWRGYGPTFARSLRRIAERLVGNGPGIAAVHTAAVREMRDDWLAAGSSRWLASDVIFLHYPIPHLPAVGIDGETSQPYLHNLRETDEVLRLLRERLEAGGLWNDMTVLVSSDHWWREDPLLGARRRDYLRYRVPFFLKLPRQSRAVAYRHAFNTVASEAMLLAILRGEIVTTEQATAWLDAHRVLTAPQVSDHHSWSAPRWDCQSTLLDLGAGIADR